MSKGESFTSYFNLLKTIIGCGLLAYPSIFDRYGLIPTILFTSISAFFSATGLLLYTECNRRINKKSTMSSITKYIYPNLRYIIDICVSLKCFAVGILFLLILKEIIPCLLIYLKSKNIWFISRIGDVDHRIILLILFLLFSPFSFFEELSQLRFASILGIILIFFILIFNVFLFIKREKNFQIQLITQKKDYLKNLGDFVYGYTCHQNIFTIQNELKSKKHLTKIIIAALLTTLFIYVSFGLLNFYVFGTNCDVNILKMYMQNNNLISFLILLSYSLMILLSFPFQSVPCRIYTLHLLGSKFENKKTLFTVLLLTVTYLLAISNLPVGTMLNYIGGSVSAMICFIFGPILYLRLVKKKFLYTLFAILTFSFGILVICGLIDKILEKIF
ncbi:hypothetical protein GVAV_002419 [Gurleya vavrai]